MTYKVYAGAKPVGEYESIMDAQYAGRDFKKAGHYVTIKSDQPGPLELGAHQGLSGQYFDKLILAAGIAEGH